MAKIKFINTHHIYNENTSLEIKALSNINLEIKEGEIHTIIGHSGSGKSTLIKHINGLLKADKGKVIVDGYEILNTKKTQKQLKAIRKKASIVFQFPELQLFAETVEKDIMFGPMSFGASLQEAKALAKKYINVVGLSNDLLQRSPFELSGGQKRRVAIAGILAIQPQILIVDEPTAALDPVGKEEIMSIFKNLNQQQGLTIILVTHNMDDVWKYSDSVSVLKEGKIQFTGSPQQLFRHESFLEDNSIDLPKHIKFINKIKKELGIGIPIEFDTPQKIVSYLKQAKGDK